MPTPENLGQKIKQSRQQDIYKWLPHTCSEIETDVMMQFKLLDKDPKTYRKLRSGQYQTTFDTFS